MSLQDLPKTVASGALSLLRLPLELIERVIPGRGEGDRAPERAPLKPDPGVSDKPTPGEALKPDPEAPKPKKPAARAAKKPAAKKTAANKAPAKKPAAAKEPAAGEKPAAAEKPAAQKAAPKQTDAAAETRAPAAEAPRVVEEDTDGLEAATDRAVKAREDLRQAADPSR